MDSQSSVFEARSLESKVCHVFSHSRILLLISFLCSSTNSSRTKTWMGFLFDSLLVKYTYKDAERAGFYDDFACVDRLATTAVLENRQSLYLVVYTEVRWVLELQTKTFALFGICILQVFVKTSVLEKWPIWKKTSGTTEWARLKWSEWTSWSPSAWLRLSGSSQPNSVNQKDR